MEIFDILIDGNVSGKIKLTDIDFTGQPFCSGYGRQFIWGESCIKVDEVNFCVPNMREYFGDAVKYNTSTGIQLKKSRLTLDDSPYKIILDQLPNYKVRQEKLSNSGGYLTLYAGKITKIGGVIGLTEIQKWHDRFHHFLYFLNGRRTAPMFYTGLHDGTNMWTDYSDYTVDMYKYVPSWSDIFTINDLPQLWKSYNLLWKEDTNRDFLITAIHWYVEANSNAGMVEGSIILIQTALELIYNWLIIENQRLIIGKDADSISAANKIRLLIFQLGINSSIPSAFADLAQIADEKDGPEAFVEIRNSLVHGQETKRAKLMKISLMAKYQALQLGIWYVELALLFILKYKGKYNNRTDGNIWRDTGVFVPWVKSEN